MIPEKAGQIFTYDCAFVGTGVISILEAIAQSNEAKSVLMIDNKSSLGGAWAPINVFGYKNVENAIHYFLPDRKAEKYMREVFGWDVFVSEKKYQLRKIFFFGHRKFNYDGLLNRLARLFHKETSIQTKAVEAAKLFIDKIKGNLQYSFYIKGGANEIVSWVSEKLQTSSVETRLNHEINKIFLDQEKNIVEIHTDKEIFYAKKIFFTHGSRIKSISSNNGPIEIVEKFLPRPAAHILIDDPSKSSFHELILDSPFIKYIHDVSHFIEGPESLEGKKLFIFGMGHDVKFRCCIYKEIIKYMKERKIISSSASFIDGHWTDVFLPTITDLDLEKIKSGSESLVEILKTENFSRAVGFYASKWNP